mmetsp:Transcript_24925/g.38414  ORF Transcript_24925/g.38414 Transcript_24925/m.38414 type:complete len:451 (-) Transcript_24925:300-1652(-)
MQNTLDPIDCSSQPLDISFHPKREHLMAAALVDGTAEIHDFSPRNGEESDDESENDTIVSSIPVHTQILPIQQDGKQHQASCRTVLWSADGSKLYTAGSAGDVAYLDAEAACSLSSDAKPLGRFQSYKNTPMNVLHQLPENSPVGPLFVTGDEKGCVRVWDERLSRGGGGKKSKSSLPEGCVLSWEEHEDYISGFDHSQDGTSLLASSADATMSVVDLRKAINKGQHQKEPILRRSDDMEDELLSIVVMKNGRKVVCGTQQGVLAVWSWGTWGDISDRFPGHPQSVDALLKVDEDTLLSGSSDGVLRLVQIQPDKLVGVIGDHDGFPIEKLQFNSTRTHVGSVSHDNLIRLWDVRMLQDDYDMEDDEGEEETKSKTPVETNAALGVAKAPRASANESDDEWEDMEDEGELDDMDDSDSDEDSDDESAKATVNDKRADRFKSDNEKFFEDL